jgi:predicted ATPase/DNA-binding SARP family transcriptional activator
VRVLRDGMPVEIGGPRAATLVALLAIRAPAAIGSDTLADELWAGEPPDGAQTTLRSYVSRLRTALGSDASIERVAGGYRLDLAPDAIDVVRFESSYRDGVELQRRRRHRRAAELLRTALGLWRGEPFGGLPPEGILGTEAARLEELHLNLIEARIESDLELGRDADVIDELEAFVARHPFRERLWGQLMVALYRAGRQADALGAYHRARAVLDEQLGIDPGDELQALEAAILRQEVPQPAGLPAPSSIGLPASLTEFIGRDRELDEVRALLHRSRLVTLVGVGGVGKTRLALEAARRAATDLVDEVAVVDLAPITDAAAVKGQVAIALGARDDAGEGLDLALERRLRGSEVLLVLDNCEHVLAPAAELAHALLRVAPDLRVLATSRELLEVAGEAAYPVPPLGLPDPDADPDAARMSEAVRLLVERATLARHGLTVDAAGYETAARIVRGLDGLPLAIELAAARAKVLTLDEIADRLRDRFELLVSRQRMTAARHRTLREAMDWSFELLDAHEQQLLARLSVFPGGATLASIAAVCLDGDEAQAERLVERLVDTSLVMPIETRRGTRYRLLETVREYAASRLAETERGALRRRHAERVRELADATNLGLEGAGKPMDFDLAREELPSIRAAIRWAQSEDPAIGVEIACAIERFWATNEPREGIAALDGLLDAAQLPEALLARGLRSRGGSRYATGDFLGGVDDYERALEIYRRLGRRADEGHLLMRLAHEAARVGDPDRAAELLDAGAAIAGEDQYLPDRYVGGILRGELALDSGRHDEGLDILAGAAALARAGHDPWWEGDILLTMAEYAMELGRVEDAGPPARDGLALAREIGSRQSMVHGVGLLAREAAAKGRPERAGRMWGGLEAEVERRVVGQWESEHDARRAQVAGLAGPGFHAAVAEGRHLAFDAVVEEALSQT